MCGEGDNDVSSPDPPKWKLLPPYDGCLLLGDGWRLQLHIIRTSMRVKLIRRRDRGVSRILSTSKDILDDPDAHGTAAIWLISQHLMRFFKT
jgi:hypothetical protein